MMAVRVTVAVDINVSDALHHLDPNMRTRCPYGQFLAKRDYVTFG